MTSSVQRIEARLQALGIEALPKNGGVLQSAAVWFTDSGQYQTLKIGESTPRSPTDDFLLAFNRSRADAIVTTGQILRDEPALCFDVAGNLGRDLGDWRKDALGRSQAPWIVVLTRGGQLPWGHPVVASDRTLILTGQEASVPEPPDSSKIIRRAAPGLIDTIAFLRTEMGCETMLIEAGPSTSSVLYQTDDNVDELMLSVCREDRLPPGVRGRAFPSAATLVSAGLHEVSSRSVQEASGLWSFHRWLRSGPGGSEVEDETPRATVGGGAILSVLA